MFQISEMRKEEIAVPLAQGLISLAIDEMTKDKEVVPDWQGAASSLLVTLSTRFSGPILEELMKRFVPGSVPHYFIMKTLGDLFSANPLDTVPRLKDVIARVLPVLSSVKQENMRWVFASGLGHFCEGILNYVANIEHAQDKSFGISSFSSDMFPAYEMLFSNWLTSSKESKVRITCIQALGSMCLILTRDQLDVQVPKLIPVILQMYKKEKELLPITQGLSMILEAAIKDGNRVLDPLLPSLLQTLHPLACLVPEYSSGSVAIKNYNELLRSIQTIAMGFSDTVITFLLERLNSKDPMIRYGTLAIFRHLISRLITQLEDKRGLLVTGIKPLINTETSLIVKKELCQTIITMATHDYLSQEGAESLLEFIIRTSSISEEEIQRFNKEKEKKKDSKETSNVPTLTPEELRTMSDNILHLATTTIHKTHKSLWPYLFETIIPAQFTEALSVVSKCLAHIASIKRQEEATDYIIDFDRAVNLPKPHAIIARLFVMLNAPLRRGSLGINVLNLLQSIGPILHPSIFEMWDSAIPKLINFLETNANTDSWNQSLWEDLVIRLASETMKIANDDEWITQYGEQLAKQLELYKNETDLKRVAFKHLGLVLQKSTNKDFIKAKLEVMLSSADSNNENERTGCAQGIGYCSASHLDMTLERLQGPPPKAAEPASKPKLLSFLSSSSSSKETTNTVNNTVILSYGYIAAYSQPNLITSRIEISILNNLKPIMISTKSLVTKECLIKTIDLIGKAMHPSHLKKEFIFKPKEDLIKILLAYLIPKEKNEINDNIRLLGLNAIATLLNLEPVLPEDLEKLLFEKLITFYSFANEDKTITSNILDNLNSVWTSVLYSQPSTSTLCKLFQTIEPFVCSGDAQQRERATLSCSHLLKKLVENLRARETPSSETKFALLGGCIAMLVPRCTDNNSTIRQSAVESIQLSLYIDTLLKHFELTNSNELPPELLLFKDFKSRIVSEEINEQFGVVHEISRVLAKIIIPEDLPDLLLFSLKGLNDPQLSSTSGTCVLLNGLLKIRGKELNSTLPKIVSGILKAMESISNEQTMNGTLHAIRSLAVNHHLDIVNLLLETPVPHSSYVIKALQSIAKDDNLVMELLNHLFDILNKSQLYEESPDPKNKKSTINVPCHLPMSATCALGELLQLEELEDLVNEHYHLFLSTLLLRVGTSNGMNDNTASLQITNTFKQFVTCAKEGVMDSMINKFDHYTTLSKPDYYKAITDITTIVCKEHPNQMQKIFTFLNPYLKGNFIGQRIVTATIFAEFINHSKNDRALLQQLVNCILSSLGDPSIKLQSLRGLGNIVAAGEEEANKYAPTVLDALMSCIDDKDETIALEAMNGLAKVFDVINEERMSPLIINICLRIKPAFDKENNDIRAAAFTLFGSLHRFGNGIAKDTFYEQIHNNLPSLILHANDDHTQVQKACKISLRQLAPLLHSKEIVDLFDSELDPSRPLDFNEFVNDLTKLLVKKYFTFILIMFYFRLILIKIN